MHAIIPLTDTDHRHFSRDTSTELITTQLIDNLGSFNIQLSEFGAGYTTMKTTPILLTIASALTLLTCTSLTLAASSPRTDSPLQVLINVHNNNCGKWGAHYFCRYKYTSFNPAGAKETRGWLPIGGSQWQSIARKHTFNPTRPVALITKPVLAHHSYTTCIPNPTTVATYAEKRHGAPVTLWFDENANTGAFTWGLGMPGKNKQGTCQSA